MANEAVVHATGLDTIDYLAILGSAAGIILIALLLAKLFGFL